MSVIQLTDDGINSEWEKDSIVDRTEPHVELAKIPSLNAKYLRALMAAKLKLKLNNVKLKKLSQLKWRYFRGILSQEELNELGWNQFPYKLLKDQVDDHVKQDDDVLNIQTKSDILEIYISSLETIMRELNSRTYQLRSIVDWQRFIGEGGPQSF